MMYAKTGEYFGGLENRDQMLNVNLTRGNGVTSVSGGGEAIRVQTATYHPPPSPPLPRSPAVTAHLTAGRSSNAQRHNNEVLNARQHRRKVGAPPLYCT